MANPLFTIAELKSILEDARVSTTGVRKKADFLQKVSEHQDACRLASVRLQEKSNKENGTVAPHRAQGLPLGFQRVVDKIKPGLTSKERVELKFVLCAISKLGYGVDAYKEPPEELVFAVRAGFKHAVKQQGLADHVVSTFEKGLSIIAEMDGAMFSCPLGDVKERATATLKSVREVANRAQQDVSEHALVLKHLHKAIYDIGQGDSSGWEDEGSVSMASGSVVETEEELDELFESLFIG